MALTDGHDWDFVEDAITPRSLNATSDLAHTVIRRYEGELDLLYRLQLDTSQEVEIRVWEIGTCGRETLSLFIRKAKLSKS